MVSSGRRLSWSHMVPLLCVLVATLLCGLCSGDQSSRNDHQQYRRGFRFGSADRFSHGFGKRSYQTDTDDVIVPDDSKVVDKRGFRNGAADRFSHGFGKRMTDTDLGFSPEVEKRGFRNGAADRFSHGFGKRYSDGVSDSAAFDVEAKRGFRKGSADRFSHGFGKRFDSLENVLPDDELLSVEELATLLQNNRNLATVIASRFVDKNGNGLINKEELFHPEKH